MTRLIIEVEFPDGMSGHRQNEIKREIQDLRETLEPYGGRIIKADLKLEPTGDPEAER